MSLKATQMGEFLENIQNTLDATLERVNGMAHVDVKAEAQSAAVQEIQRQGASVAALSDALNGATKAAKDMEMSIKLGAVAFKVFSAAIVFAALMLGVLGYQTYQLRGEVQQVIWNQTHPESMRGVFDSDKYENDRLYEENERAKMPNGGRS